MRKLDVIFYYYFCCRQSRVSGVAAKCRIQFEYLHVAFILRNAGKNMKIDSRCLPQWHLHNVRWHVYPCEAPVDWENFGVRGKVHAGEVLREVPDKERDTPLQVGDWS
jgi:hypothetical protein